MAGRLREGAEAGFFDMQGNTIHVGDRVKDLTGATWRINSWLQAVPDGEGKAIPAKQLNISLCELQDPNAPTPEPAPEPEPVKETVDDHMLDLAKAVEVVEENTIKEEALWHATDQELADELRRRGYDVEATKTITVSL